MANAQTITLGLADVSNGTETANVALPIGFLFGDATTDGTVNSGDAIVTRNRSGQTADANNFRSDVNCDGTIHSGDALVARARSGTTLYP